MDYDKIENVAQETLNTQILKECPKDLLEPIIEQFIDKLDICAGIPVVSVFSTVHKLGKSLFDYKMCIRLLNFYVGCKNMSIHKRNEFVEKNVRGKESEVGYKILQMLERLDVDEKAELIGKLYVNCAERQYDLSSYFRICRCIEKCSYEDLQYLKSWIGKETICSQNTIIPQEIIESLYNDGLLMECGIDGGGFKEDDEAGTIYALNKFGKIIVDLL